VDSPFGLAVGGGSVWAADYNSDTITRIDTGSGRPGEEPIAVEKGPASVAVADGTVWVVNDTAGKVSKVDAARREVVGGPINIAAGTRAGDTIAAGDGKVWVVDLAGKIVPIDASNGKAGEPIPLPTGAKALELALGEGGLWVLATDGSVTLVDPASGEPGDRVDVAGTMAPDTGQLAVGEGAVWVAALNENIVVRVDAGSHALVEIPVAEGLAGDLAVGAGYVWTIDATKRLVQIDPNTKEILPTGLVSRFDPTNHANVNDMTAGAGAVWIADLDANRITRVVP
jgi:streptogramin lyase